MEEIVEGFLQKENLLTFNEMMEEIEDISSQEESNKRFYDYLCNLFVEFGSFAMYFGDNIYLLEHRLVNCF
jgi:hypothetical protein